MEDYRSFTAEDLADWDFPVADEPCMDLPPMIGADERRMHVRAYEMWLSLLDGRDYPAIADLDSDALGEFGPYSVLLDFAADRANPSIAYLGRALREEGELGADVATVADVPARALLSRLTAHYAEILENRAPVGFEAEFVSHRGQPMLYRGILMPYSSDGRAIDLVHGVINWKETAEQALSPDILHAITTAFAGPARPPAATPAEAAPEAAIEQDEPDLAELVEDARELAGEARACEGRTHAALYRAISLAYDVALAAEADPAGFAALLAGAGIVPQARAPMTPVVKLVFGRDHDRKRLTEFAAVLTHARRLCLAAGMVESWLTGLAGGIKAVVAAERGERRPALKVDKIRSARMMLGSAPARGLVDLGKVADDVVLLIARREEDGRLAIVSRPIGERALVDRALQRFNA
ncbi:MULTISPECIES: hypothetical protein [unclassified Sphingomonas]|uniref:hypothetical protein n=1 Tax=unclassified Sphingomonas TaxID=196159 RepID=UPI0006FCA0D6|nr:MULTISPECIES: hypothetical protein [unclassified Sphingomonas]KQX19087.1 hypothetical protein ASD17_10985 [Sphingomonas sp. Root1294]KQY65288.1 hypothetical protein ASD39_14180 [Sphingomonas sp. Root50]KRB95417.1 hypothetical protein ASE22_05875 [Sphingomonas sp. Root720]